MSKPALNSSPVARLAWACALWAVLGLSPIAPAPAQQATPETVKAAFLYNFGSFVEWPAASPGPAFTIAVCGAPSILEELRRIATGRTVLGHPVQVREVDAVSEIEDAHIVFVGAGQAGRLARFVEATRGRPVLIVSDSKGALDQGATINFAIVDQRVRFEVSLAAAERARLGLSSRLLAIAFSVQKNGQVPGERPEQYAGREAPRGETQGGM
jgi:hypothetical protein